MKKRIYKDRQEALADVAEYIDGFYNPVGRHSHLGGLSPHLFEAAHRRPKGVSPLKSGNSGRQVPPWAPPGIPNSGRAAR
ncbi:MAG: hypothetical protein IPO52_15215 [Gemmatimonadetes bacterium]|nr:hypothetical protein [Gemmatimonadota bacterium]